MKNKLIGSVILLFLTTVSVAQNSFTLQESIDYALKNNAKVKNAILGIENAKQKVKETTAIGLPQVNGESNFQNFIDLPTTVVPASTFNPGAPEGEVAELTFGTKYNMDGSITASQLIFSGSYLVGLQTAKKYKAVSIYQKKKSEDEVKESVLKAYYGVLVSQKTITTLKEIVATTEKIYDDTKKVFKQGLIEGDNVDQLSLSVLSSKNALKSAERQLVVAKNFLKMEMSYPMETEINVSTEFDNVINSLDSKNGTTEFQFSQNIDYMLLNQQMELGILNLKYQKSLSLPTLSTFFQHKQTASRDKFNFFENKPWYASNLWGVKLSIPIWSSGQSKALRSQAKIGLEQTKNSLILLESGIKMQMISAETNYDNAYDSYQTAKQTVKITKGIYVKNQIKFKEGIISSLILSQLQSQYLSAETQNISAMYNLIMAKIELDKISNKL